MLGLITPLQQSIIPALAPATQGYSETSANKRNASAAASLSNLSFRKKEECTSSVSSLLATASFSTVCSESIIGGNDDTGQLFSSCINYTVVPEASTTIQMTADPFAELCCGPCGIMYPQASILHWPVQRTNTWCDSIQSSLRIYKSAAIGDENYPQPTLDPSFYQNALALDPEIGGNDALDSDGNMRAPYTRPPHNGTYAVAKDGFVFVSPSIYVVFPIILATNDCGLVGNAYTSWTLGVPEHQLSTYQTGMGASVFNPADLGCPGPDPGNIDPLLLEDEANQGAPSVLLPADLTSLDPAWKSCVLGGLDLGRDPPRALRPASNMVPKATSHNSAPIETQSIASPCSTPKVSRPDQTPLSQQTKSESSLVPEDFAKVANEAVQEPSSVCSPAHRSRSQQSAPTASLSPQPAMAQISLRDAFDLDTAKTAPLQSSVETYASATSNAGVVDPILAWASEMQSLASVGGLPPVAPSNPYLALPRHRSAKRTYNSSRVTQLRESTIRSTNLLISDSMAGKTLVRPSTTSVADMPDAEPSFTGAPTWSVSVLPLSAPVPAPSDPKAIEKGISPYEPCGQGDLELAVTTTRDYRHFSSALSESVSLAPWAVISTLEHSHPSMEHSTGKSDQSGSPGPGSRLQSMSTVGRNPSRVTNTVISSSSITSAVGTTSPLGLTPSTQTAFGCRRYRAESKGLWFAFLGCAVFLFVT